MELILEKDLLLDLMRQREEYKSLRSYVKHAKTKESINSLIKQIDHKIKSILEKIHLQH
jgi:hypothetical protein